MQITQKNGEHTETNNSSIVVKTYRHAKRQTQKTQKQITNTGKQTETSKH